MKERSFLDLSGVFDFSFYTEEPDYTSLQYQTALSVPGCFDVSEPYFSRRGWGIYHRSVQTGGKVKLGIDGVGIEAKVFWDGTLVGLVKYAYMPEEFVFDAGAEGEHELVIAVCNKYNNIFFPFYDFYAFGGIFGEVILERLPERYISAVKINTEDFASGKIRIQAEASEGIDGELLIAFDNGGANAFPMKDGKADVFTCVPDFKLWSPGAPNLHKAVLQFGEDRISVTFGIREIKALGQELFLNGEKLRLMGYNRHESHPQFGAATPPQLMAADLQLIRTQGANFIRGSHYPQRRTYLDLCDKIGMLVWEETLGWDVKPPELLSERFLEQQVDQARKLTRISFNHPCIIIRGFLNETESQMPEVRPIIQKLYDTIRAEDEKCLITYSSNKYAKDCCMDIVDIVAMNPYPAWNDADLENISNFCNIAPTYEALANAIPKDKPYMISETGGSAIYGFHDPYRARWSEEYQAELLSREAEIALNNPRYCGFTIWHFSDAKTYINWGVLARPRGFNDKGVTDEYRRPKASWNALKEIIKHSEYYKHNGGIVQHEREPMH